MKKRISMKLLAVVIALALIGATAATAATFWNVYEWNVLVKGWLHGAGTGQISGFKQVVTASSSGDTLTAAESGGIFTNASAFIVNLPAAAAGVGPYTFCVGSGAFTVNPGAADKILVLTDTAGDAIRSSTAGSCVTLTAIDSTNWVVTAMPSPDWSDVN
jgi:hypothetical protein